MRRLPFSALLLLAAMVATAGAAAQQAESNRGVLPAIAQAPREARERKNPYEGRAEAVLAGGKLYRRYCAECHGEDARGKGRAVNLRSARVQNATPGELVWFLRNGNLASGMPSWSRLPEQQRWQITSYLKSLRGRFLLQ